MRISSAFFLVLIFLTTCQSQENKRHVTEQNKLPAHPRLLLFQDEERALQEAVSLDSTWSSVHAVILKQCDRILSKAPVEYKLSGKRLLEKAGECRRRVFFLSYAWRMTHERRYLERAEMELLAVCSFNDWNPSHFLDVAEMTMAVAIGYDWLNADLPKTSLDILRDAIVNKGLRPSLEKNYVWWLTSDSNWNQVCNAGLTYGALAVYEDEPTLASQIINRAIESIKLPMKVYEPDGAYPEGYAYWGYGTTFNVLFIDALEKNFSSSFDLPVGAGFMNTGQYLVNMIGPTGLSFNYSDGNPRGRLNTAMFWFARKSKDNSLLYAENTFLKDKDKITSIRELPAVLIWGYGINTKSIPPPENQIYVGHGNNPVALMRTSWKPDGIFLAIKGGSASNGHAHLDAGSFVLDALGERWAMDYQNQEYGSLEAKGINLFSLKQSSDRWKIFRNNNLAHNTLTFNNQDQLVKGYSPIIQYSSNSQFLSTTVDLTEIYKGQVKKASRGVAIAKESYVVIKDEIELSTSPCTVRWTMATPAEVKIINNNTAELTQHGKKLLMVVKEPANVNITTWTTKPVNDYEESNEGTVLLGFEVTGSAENKIDLSVLLIPHDDINKFDNQIPKLQQWINDK